MKSRGAVNALLKKHVKDYDKHVRFEHYKEGYSQAVNRAKALDEIARVANTIGCNPSTGMHKLTESIRVN